MALLGKTIIFRKGNFVWFAYQDEYGWQPKQGVITIVTKGCVHIKAKPRIVTEFSPNSRMLCLTKEECLEICELLNQELVKETLKKKL